MEIPLLRGSWPIVYPGRAQAMDKVWTACSGRPGKNNTPLCDFTLKGNMAGPIWYVWSVGKLLMPVGWRGL